MKRVIIILSSIVLSSIAQAEVRYVKLKVQGADVKEQNDNGFPLTDSVELDPTDQIEYVSLSSSNNTYRVLCYIDGVEKALLPPREFSSGAALSGYTKFVLTLDPQVWTWDDFRRDGNAIITLRITTKSSYSVSKEDLVSATSSGGTSVVIPEDEDGIYEVVLESSTDMVTWTRANPGLYGGDTKKRFFRTRVIKKG